MLLTQVTILHQLIISNVLCIIVVTLDHPRSKKCIRPRRPPPAAAAAAFLVSNQFEKLADDVLLRIKEAQERLNFEIRRQYSLCEANDRLRIDLSLASMVEDVTSDEETLEQDNKYACFLIS